MNSITLDLSSIIQLSDEQYYQLATTHRELRMERTPAGKIVIMPPTGGETGKRNFSLLGQLWLWVQQNPKLGVGFDSSTEFNLPNGGDRSPDASWIKLERWNALSEDERQRFPPICPDFVIELRSETDNLKKLQAKMQEYLGSGIRLGWLIDPKTKKVEIYRPSQEVEVLNPTTLSGEDVLPGFVLDLKPIWGE